MRKVRVEAKAVNHTFSIRKIHDANQALNEKELRLGEKPHVLIPASGWAGLPPRALHFYLSSLEGDSEVTAQAH